MRSVFGFCAALALGFFVAIVVVTGINSPLFYSKTGAATPVSLDYASLFVGLSIGIVIGFLAKIEWEDVPRRVVAWCVRNAFNFMLALIAFLMLAVLLAF